MNEINIPFLEEKYGITLPEDYAFFIKLFFIEERYYKAEIAGIQSSNFYKHLNFNYISNIRGERFDEINFLELEENLIEWDSLGYTDEHYEENYFPIARADMGSLFCLGIGTSNYGKIYLDSSWPGRFILVADNIFKFLELIKIETIEKEDLDNIDHSRLYKNWGEDFWRVREEKEEK